MAFLRAILLFYEVDINAKYFSFNLLAGIKNVNHIAKLKAKWNKVIMIRYKIFFETFYYIIFVILSTLWFKIIPRKSI